MIGRSKELEDVGRVASSFPTYLGKIEATLLAGYIVERILTQTVDIGIFLSPKNFLICSDFLAESLVIRKL